MYIVIIYIVVMFAITITLGHYCDSRWVCPKCFNKGRRFLESECLEFGVDRVHYQCKHCLYSFWGHEEATSSDAEKYHTKTMLEVQEFLQRKI